MSPSAAAPKGSPFALLGLPAAAAVTDDDVRAAWRRVATATHPDRPDGGDPARFAAASAAYTALRTRSGRGEVLADLTGGGARRVPMPREARAAREFATGAQRAAALAGRAPAGWPGGAGTGPAGARWPSRVAYRFRYGRPAVLALRCAIVAAVGAGSAALVGAAPATPALITGAATWLVLTGRNDLARPG